MDGGAWWAAVHGVAKRWTQLSDFTFTFHFHALEKEMATHSSVLAWRIPGMGEPGGVPSMGSHRVGHDWSDLAAAAAHTYMYIYVNTYIVLDWGTVCIMWSVWLDNSFTHVHISMASTQVKIEHISGTSEGFLILHPIHLPAQGNNYSNLCPHRLILPFWVSYKWNH